MLPRERNEFATRGAIEGFYGPPFSHEQRISLLRFLGEQGYNAYVYAPKNDPLHRERWRDPYDVAEVARFRALAAESRSRGVTFLYAIAPGLTYDASDPRDFALLRGKIEVLVEAGARGVALLFDDLTADSTTLDPVQQAKLVGRVASAVAALDPALDFWFIGNFYCGDAAALRAGGGFWETLYRRNAPEYFAAYADHVPPEVPILWTGPAVFSARITASDAAAFRALVGRPVILWDNFPVNDTLPGQIFLGPYVGREPEALRSLRGVVLNLMNQAHANRIPLAAAARFFADPAGYDPAAALRDAIAVVAPEGAARSALANLVDQQRGHPVLAASDAATSLGVLVARALDGPREDEAALDELRSHLEMLADNDTALRRHVADRDLIDELAPWSEQLTRLAQAALSGLDALRGSASFAAYEDARARARSSSAVVGATILPSPLSPFAAGQGQGVDRFAELFEALDRRLASRRAAARR